MADITPDYGVCPCTGQYQKLTIEVRLTVNDKPIVLENVPQGVCPLCGSRVYKAQVLEYIEATMRGKWINIKLD